MPVHRRRALRRAPRVALVVVCCAIACGDWDQRPRLIANSPTGPVGPSVSPIVVDTGQLPGGRLAFVDQAKGSPARVYTMRVDGSELMAVSPADRSSWMPIWSPDGTRLAYWSDGPETGNGVWVVRGDGTGSTRISDGGHSPFWLDDARVGYACDVDLCVVGADGSQRSTLLARTQTYGVYDENFRLSPDGQTLAFTRYDPFAGWDYGSSSVFVLKVDGGGEQRLPATVSSYTWGDAHPSWSPDGRRIAFSSAAFGILVAAADGGTARSISGFDRASVLSREIGVGGPAWSPDGKQIVFGGSARAFYIANADGFGSIRRVRVSMPDSDAGGTYERHSWSWTSR